MYLTQSNVIRNLSKEEYAMLREMCQYSNNLYNVALYNIRQYYFQEKKFLKYEENYHVCKENENYGLLQAGVSQQIWVICVLSGIRLLDINIRLMVPFHGKEFPLA